MWEYTVSSWTFKLVQGDGDGYISAGRWDTTEEAMKAGQAAQIRLSYEGVLASLTVMEVVELKLLADWEEDQ